MTRPEALAILIDTIAHVKTMDSLAGTPSSLLDLEYEVRVEALAVFLTEDEPLIETVRESPTKPVFKDS